MMASPENCTRPQTQESTCLHESTERPSLDTNPDDFSSSLSQTDIPALEKNLKHLLAYPTSFDDVLNPHMHAAIMFIMDHIIPCAGQVVPPDSMQGDVMRVLSRFGREWPLSGRRRVGDYSEDKKHPTLGLKRDSEISELDLNDEGAPEVSGGSQTSQAGRSSNRAETRNFEEIRQDENSGGSIQSSSEAVDGTAGESHTEASHTEASHTEASHTEASHTQASVNQIDKKYGNYQPPTVETIQDEAFNKLVW